VTAHSENGWTLLPHLGASLVYLHNLIYHGESLINNVAWSLEIEIQFYILVPILARVFAIRKTVLRRGVIIAVAAAITIHAWLFIDPTSWMYLTIARFLQFFLVGFLLADIYLTSWNERPTLTWRWDLVTLAGWPVLIGLWNSPGLSRMLLPFGAEPGLSTLAFPGLAFLLYVAVFRGRITNKIMTNLWITSVGGMCYTIYLFHNLLIGMVVRATGALAPFGSYTMNMLLQTILVMPPVLLVCAAYFVAIERPCMRKDWPKRFADRCSTLAQGAVAKLKLTLASRP
jgi:peptidoglycan/LPS O-acetylase OafA/YrhL